MPIYEYICKRCGGKFEVLQRGSNNQEPTCPECGAKEVQKIFSVFGFSSGGRFVSSSSKGESCSACGVKNCGSCR